MGYEFNSTQVCFALHLLILYPLASFPFMLPVVLLYVNVRASSTPKATLSSYRVNITSGKGDASFILVDGWDN